MAVCIGIETVEGVEGTGIGIVLGVLFSSSRTSTVVEITLEGVVVNVLVLLLLIRVFCNISLCFLFRSSKMFVALDFDESVEEIGENGFRAMGVFGSKFSPLTTAVQHKKKQAR